MPNTSLLDIQINGFAGVDFQRTDYTAADLRRAVEALRRHRTARFFATFITDSIPALAAKLSHFENLRSMDPVVDEAVCGYHLEGPWLSPEPGYRGAHDPQHMGPPNWRDFASLQKIANGRIRLVTLAPEWPGSDEPIRAMVDAGVQVSLGHTNASNSAIDAAIGAGARFCTHLGNAVPLTLPRHDNVIQRLLARDELSAFLIPDGIHLPPFALRNFFRAKPFGKALFTTDAMAAAGAPPGRYSMGSLEIVTGEDRVVRLPGSQLLAGSALTPAEGVVNAEGWLGLSRGEAESLFSTAIARHFGIDLPSLD